MVEQMRVVLLTYRYRIVFAIALFVALPIICYGEGLSLLIHGDPLGYIVLTIPIVYLCSVLLGHHLKVQLASYRSALVPHYATPHLQVAFLLALASLGLAGGLTWAASTAAFSATGYRVSVSIAGMTAAIWTLALVGFSSTYFWYAFGAMLPVWTFLAYSTTVLGALSKLVGGSDASWVLPTLVLDLACTFVIGARLLHLQEGKIEYESKYLTSISLKSYWSKSPNERGRLSALFWRRSERYLDSMSSRFTDRFTNHVRHFEYGYPRSIGSFWAYGAVLAAALFCLRLTGFAVRSDTFSIPFLTFFPAISLLSQLQHFEKNGLAIVFMLPLSRGQIVARYGGALFVLTLKNWFCWTLATMLAASIPIRGHSQEIPSLALLLASLTAQLPMFGILGLTLGRPGGFALGVAACALFVLMPFSEASQNPLLPAVACIAGSGLIALAYRRWRDMDLTY